MADVHDRLIQRLRARDPGGAVKTLLQELEEARTAIMDKIMQEEAGSWHMGTGKRSL
jgi:DNA-binding GntR family transcriptional regulator